MTRISIDRENETLNRVHGFWFWKKQERFELDRFDKARLSAESSLVEEGYGTITYSVILEGGGTSCEILNTNDEREARTVHTEVSQLLVRRASTPRDKR